MKSDNFKEKPNTFMQIHDTKHLSKAFLKKNTAYLPCDFQYVACMTQNQTIYLFIYFMSLIQCPLYGETSQL